jgi:hypothetical protein
MMVYIFLFGFSAFVLLLAWLLRDAKAWQHEMDKSEELRRAMEDARKADGISQDVDRLADVDVVNKLRSKWSRK